MFPNNSIDIHISVAYSDLLPDTSRAEEPTKEIARLRESASGGQLQTIQETGGPEMPKISLGQVRLIEDAEVFKQSFSRFEQ
jgi:hypothetical protein